MPKKIIILSLIFIFVPIVFFANGGDQRVFKNKYLINLSRAPFTPRAGIKISMLASFVDIQKNKPINENLIVKVRVAKISGSGGQREFLFEQDNLIAESGVLEFAYTFTETGLHEIFFGFAFPSAPQEIYEVPDFLIDVQKQEESASVKNFWFIGAGSGIAGLIIGLLISKTGIVRYN